MFTRLLAWLHYSLIDFFIITKWITNTLDICLSWIMSRVWSGQSQGVRYWGFLQNSLFEQAARVSPKEFPGVIHFCRRSFCYFSIVWWVLLRFSRPLFLAYCGDSMIFFWEFLETACYVPGSLVLAFCCYCLLMNKVSWDFILCSLADYFNSRIYSISVRRK